ncbi:MAG: hypothetical protein ABIJ48_07435 [Actinomycetota bacterium]
MRRRAWIMIVALVAGLLAVSATAMAAKEDGKKRPPTTTTTTTAPTLWTCEARVANGAVWVLGTFNEVGGFYTVSGLPACIDLLAEHTGAMRWRVDWIGTVTREPIKGLQFVFETEVHGVVYAETVATTASGIWETDVLDPPEEGFVFVAMPHHKDKWTSITITVTPLPPGP